MLTPHGSKHHACIFVLFLCLARAFILTTITDRHYLYYALYEQLTSGIPTRAPHAYKLTISKLIDLHLYLKKKLSPGI